MDESEQLRRSVETNMLMQNYGQVRQELMLYISNYKASVKYMDYVLIAIVAVTSIALRDNFGITLFRSRLFWLISNFSLTTIIGYISYDLLESQYALKALAARAAVLERIINGLIGKSWLIWESHLSPQFFSVPRIIKGVANPSIGLAVHWGAFVVAGLFVPSIVMYFNFWNNPSYSSQNGTFQVVAVLLLLYSLGTGVYILRCNFTIFRRMSREALRVASKTAKDHGAIF